jgi:antitoxin CcdA
MVTRASRKPAPGRKPANLSIDAELLRQARRLGINLSRTLEQRLSELVRDARAREWVEGNREAIETYNRHIEEHGAFSDKLRRF